MKFGGIEKTLIWKTPHRVLASIVPRVLNKLPNEKQSPQQPYPAVKLMNHTKRSTEENPKDAAATLLSWGLANGI